MPAAAARPRRQDGCERGGADSQTRVPATAAAAGKAGEGRAGRRGGVAASARGLPQRPLTFARARRLGGQVGGCLAATMRWIGCRGGGEDHAGEGRGSQSWGGTKPWCARHQARVEGPGGGRVVWQSGRRGGGGRAAAGLPCATRVRGRGLRVVWHTTPIPLRAGGAPRSDAWGGGGGGQGTRG